MNLEAILELKAELAQLAAENRRLREAMEKALSTFWTRRSTIDDHSETYWSAQGGNKLPYTVLTEAMDGCASPTPGLGAAMLKVVEDAKYWESKVRYTADDRDQQEAEDRLLGSIQDLKELEAKHEP